MKRFLPAILLVLLASQAYPVKLGLEFTASESLDLAANIRLSEEFELKPKIGFVLGDETSFELIFDANIYLPRLGELEHYAGPRVGIMTWENGDRNNNSGTEFWLNGHYGVRYTINEYLSLFGEVGLNITFDPFVLSTVRPGLGCTIYLPAFD